MQLPSWYTPGVAQVATPDDLTYRRGYSCPPRQALLCAYAQARGDWNTWSYEVRYGHQLRRRRFGWLCGSFWCYDPDLAAAAR